MTPDPSSDRHSTTQDLDRPLLPTLTSVNINGSSTEPAKKRKRMERPDQEPQNNHSNDPVTRYRRISHTSQPSISTAPTSTSDLASQMNHRFGFQSALSPQIFSPLRALKRCVSELWNPHRRSRNLRAVLPLTRLARSLRS